MTSAHAGIIRSSEIAVGDELPPFELPVTAAVIVAGAIASRDFMPAHHDRDFATAQGAPDIFMNILTTNGYVSRFVTDWAGPEAFVRKIAIRLGAQRCPDSPCDSLERFPARATRGTSALSRWKFARQTISEIMRPGPWS